jgi:transposase
MFKGLLEIPLDAEILSRTPPEVIELILNLLERVSKLEAQNAELVAQNAMLLRQNALLEKRIVELESRLNRKSTNSNKPPSSDSPFEKKQRNSGEKEKRKRNRQGYGRKRLEPTETHDVMPVKCSCGSACHGEPVPFYTHQVVELPEIELIVEDYVLYQAECSECGKMVKGEIPYEKRTGYGPRLSAVIVELAGVHGDSRRGVQDFLVSVLGISVSQGAIQKIINRATEAITPHYEAIRGAARQAPVNHIDETSWKTNGCLRWLWTMTSVMASFFMINRHRSRAAFEELIGEWQGILVSDGYGLYRKWVHGRQTCLAHLIRRAIGVSEHRDPDIAAVGINITKELQLLCHMAKVPPDIKEWNDFYQRLMLIFRLNGDCDDVAGQLVRHLMREVDSLWTFLDVHGVEPTNNIGERSLRFPVMYRKRSFGTRQECGERFVERIMSLRQTCRIQTRRTFPVLVDALQAWLNRSSPDLSFINTRTP